MPPVPRVLKRLEAQKQRTQAKAEVFTPSWVCEKMITMGEENGALPDAETDPAGYINSTVLEITCGEAPFLVSRYDTVTGHKIRMDRRKGLLDRKMRQVNKWFGYSPWVWWSVADNAYESTYGYEYQGDNLLLARANLLLTYCENYRWQFGRDPDAGWVRRIAAVISWNLWQMDGLTGCVPSTDIPCVINDWNTNEKILFQDIGREKT